MNMYHAYLRESRTWDADLHAYGDEVTYIVWCPAPGKWHGKSYEGTSRVNAEAILAEHVDCVPRQDEDWPIAFTTVAGRHHVMARFMRPEDLYRTHSGRKTRAYVTVTESEVAMPRPPYGSARGDGSEEDRLWRLYNRWELKAMRLKLSRVTRVLEVLTGLQIPTEHWHFSRKAGCSCPCSPGFILDGQVKLEAHRAMGTWRNTPVDIWVD